MRLWFVRRTLRLALGASLIALGCSSAASTNGDTGAGGSAGALAAAGASSLAGAMGQAGALGGAGAAASAGSAASIGGAPTAGTSGLAGAGNTNSGGAGGANLNPLAGGSAGASGSTSAAGATGSCGSSTQNSHPFGCKFAWGIADPGTSLASYSYLQFMSYWVDSSISAAGTYTACNGCNWLKTKVSSTNIIPAYYAYIIGFLAHANGIVDGNQTGSKKLTTDGAALIKADRAAIISAYAWYAKATHDAWPTKPLVWLLEGDFVQFAASSQSSPLTYAELGQLAADITCAIKANMPNAVVAIDQSSWNTDDVTNSYWAAMKGVNYDLVWTTGVGDNNGFIEAGTDSSTYNHTTATYAYLYKLTGRPVLVDTSAGASAAGDSWSTASVSELDARIAEGVIGANISGTAPNGLQSNIAELSALTGLPNCQ